MEAVFIHGMFSDDRFIECPYCKDNNGYVHLGLPKHISGKDNYEGSKIYDIGVRGDVLVIPFWCEGGHRWVLVLGEHKGNIIYKVVLTDFESLEDDEAIAKKQRLAQRVAVAIQEKTPGWTL